MQVLDVVTQDLKVMMQDLVPEVIVQVEEVKILIVGNSRSLELIMEVLEVSSLGWNDVGRILNTFNSS